MIINGKTLFFSQDFNDMLKDIVEWYINEGYDKYATDFFKDVDTAIKTKIAPYPERHPEYAFKRTPNKIYRRYILNKKFYIIYKISPTKEQ